MAAADAAVRDSQNGIRGLPKWDPRTPKMRPAGFLELKTTGGPHRGPKIHTPLDRYPEPSLVDTHQSKFEITTITEMDRILVALTDNSTGNTVDFPISHARPREILAEKITSLTGPIST